MPRPLHSDSIHSIKRSIPRSTFRICLQAQLLRTYKSTSLSSVIDALILSEPGSNVNTEKSLSVLSVRVLIIHQAFFRRYTVTAPPSRKAPSAARLTTIILAVLLPEEGSTAVCDTGSVFVSGAGAAFPSGAISLSPKLPPAVYFSPSLHEESRPPKTPRRQP